MKVFICWSGRRSRLVAEAMRQWLPNVIQAVEPFMSDYIEKGKSWPDDLDTKLRESDVGLICLTRENIEEPWIQFEAGAVYMHLSQERVCPYVLDLSPSEIPWPLARFQATRAVKEDTRRLLDTINKALDKSALDGERLNETFEVWWPRLEEKITAAQKLPAVSAPAKRESADILEELVSLIRSQSRQIEGLGDIIVSLSQHPILTAPGFSDFIRVGGDVPGGAGIGITGTSQSEGINLAAVQKVAPNLYAQLVRVLTEKGFKVQ